MPVVFSSDLFCVAPVPQKPVKWWRKETPITVTNKRQSHNSDTLYSLISSHHNFFFFPFFVIGGFEKEG